MSIPFPSNEEPTPKNLKKYGRALRKLRRRNVIAELKFEWETCPNLKWFIENAIGVLKRWREF